MEEAPSKDTVAEFAKDLATGWPKPETSKRHELLNHLLKRVVLGSASVTIGIDKTKLLAIHLVENPEALASLRAQRPDILTLTSAFRALCRGSELRLVTVKSND